LILTKLVTEIAASLIHMWYILRVIEPHTNYIIILLGIVKIAESSLWNFTEDLTLN